MYKLNKLAAGSVIAAAAALASAGAALADGYVAKGKTVVYERPTDWSGVYFGVGSGYQWSNIDVCIPGTPCGFGQAFSVDQDTGFLSAHLGLQHQWGGVVLGVEGGWMSTIRDDYGSVSDAGCAGLGTTCEARLNDILTVGGRAGWAAGHWMPYVTGGYASARFEQAVRVAGVVNNTAGARADGWYIGGGVEWAVSPGWTAGVEYRHYEFNDAVGPAFTPAGVFVNDRNFDVSTDTIGARVSWRWGRPEAKPLK